MATRPTNDPVETIKALYFETSKQTVQRDLTRAIDLFKALDSEEDRERAAVYMDGLSQMRSEWGVRPKADSPTKPRNRGKTSSRR